MRQSLWKTGRRRQAWDLASNSPVSPHAQTIGREKQSEHSEDDAAGHTSLWRLFLTVESKPERRLGELTWCIVRDKQTGVSWDGEGRGCNKTPLGLGKTVLSIGHQVVLWSSRAAVQN